MFRGVFDNVFKIFKGATDFARKTKSQTCNINIFINALSFSKFREESGSYILGGGTEFARKTKSQTCNINTFINTLSFSIFREESGTYTGGGIFWIFSFNKFANPLSDFTKNLRIPLDFRRILTSLLPKCITMNIRNDNNLIIIHQSRKATIWEFKSLII